MKNVKSNRKYLLLFVIVTALNVILVGVLLNTVFGQTFEIKKQEQPPIIVEVMSQEANPLQTTIINIDNTAESYQTINYAIQNVSLKRIKAYVFLYSNKSGVVGAGTKFFQKFSSGKIIQDSIFEERANLQLNDKIIISIDYVEFEDGSSWGENSMELSEQISGFSKGQKYAVEHIQNLLVSGKNSVVELMRKQITEINLSIPENENTEWQKGFSLGYKQIIVKLQNAYETGGTVSLQQELEELKTIEKGGNK